MDQPVSKPRIEPKPGEMPPIVEPPLDNQAEMPIPEPSTTEKLEGIVASPTQVENPKPEVLAQPIPRTVEPKVPSIVPTSDTEGDQEEIASKLIEEGPKSDQGLEGLAKYSDEVGSFTEPE